MFKSLINQKIVWNNALSLLNDPCRDSPTLKWLAVALKYDYTQFSRFFFYVKLTAYLSFLSANTLMSSSRKLISLIIRLTFMRDVHWGHFWSSCHRGNIKVVEQSFLSITLLDQYCCFILVFIWIVLSGISYLSHFMRKSVYVICEQKGADQPAHSRSLISTFVVRCLDSIIPILALSKISRL